MNSASTLDLLRTALANAADPAVLAKNATFSQPSGPTVGLQTYDLEGPAKNLYPVLTPLRNRIPRVKGNGSTQANWKAVTAIDPGMQFSGVMEGRRGGLIGATTAEYFAAYRTLGLESAVTFEADLSAEGFDDLRARATNSLLQAMMLAEERVILGGNTTLALGQTNGGVAPSLAASTTGGAIGATTAVSVVCVGLTFEARQRFSVAGTAPTSVLTVTPTDGQGSFTTGGGVAQKTPNGTVTTGAGATNSVVATVAPQRGAFAYAWYWGAAGSETLGAISDTAGITITTATGQGTSGSSALASALANADNSKSSLVHDGLLTITSNPAFNGYYKTQTQGLGLTGDATGGIVEFDAMLQYFWDNLRLSPSRIIVASQEMGNIRKKILAGGNSSSTRFTFNVQQGSIVGGGMPKGYLNPYTMGGAPAEIPIELHPNMPSGTVYFDTDDVPYPMNNISNIKQVRCRRDYHQMEWPLRTRMYEYGVYSDQVLQHYFPPATGILTNLSNA